MFPPSAAQPYRTRSGPVARRDLVRMIAGTALLATGLTGCTQARPAEADGPVQLSVFWWGSQRRAELTEQALRLYSELHPRVSFRVTWQGSAGYYQRLSTQAAAGNAPDLFQIDDSFLAEYAQRDILLDLSEHVEHGRLDLRELPASLAQYGQVNGRTVAVAAAENTAALAVNRSLLRRIGMPAPRLGMTYDEFVDWAVQVTRRSSGRVAGTMDLSADHRALWLWLRAQGIEFYRGQQLGFDVADLTDWFEFWRAARSRRATPSVPLIKSANGGEVNRQLIATGRTAASLIWSSQLPELQRLTRDELGIVCVPGAEQVAWARAAMYWTAFRGTRSPDTVVNVINFLTNNPAAGRVLGAERGVSANVSVRRVVQGSLVDESMRRAAAFETEMTHRFGPAPAPPPKGHAEVRALLVAAAESAQSGRSSSREAAVAFVSQANTTLTS
ncbi:MAG TPA: ABC transporter substrate-binding protein [Micromonospora sp.]